MGTDCRFEGTIYSSRLGRRIGLAGCPSDMNFSFADAIRISSSAGVIIIQEKQLASKKRFENQKLSMAYDMCYHMNKSYNYIE